MKVLHTSDWHLGRVFHGASLLTSQERALDRVVEVTAEAEVDVVVVAGDLYDRAIPPADAVDLLGDVLRRLADVGTHVVAITGNHDSPGRVGSLDPVLRPEVTLRGRFRPDAPVVVADPRGGPDLVVHPVPYLEPLAVALDERTPGEAPADGDRIERIGEERPRRPTQHEVLARAMGHVRNDVARREAVRSLVVAHAFAAGAAPSDSERELSVGGVDRVPLSVFDGVSYVALGHLHRPQALTDRIAYSGSLLPYSFSETAASSMRLVDLAADGTVSSEVVELGVERRVATLTGRLDQLLADPAHRAAEACWVRVRLTDEVLPRHALERLRDRFAHTVVLEHSSPAGAVRSEDPRKGGDQVSDLDLALAFIGERLGRPANEAEAALVRAAFDLVDARDAERGPAGLAVAAVQAHEERHGPPGTGAVA